MATESIRDEIAIIVMKEICRKELTLDSLMFCELHTDIAVASYKIADAMLKIRFETLCK